MALFQISNDKITIQVDSMGAELKSLKEVAADREYMWNGDPKYWKRTSPVLFPLVGGVREGVYRLDGKEYPMGQHGLARDMEFKLKSQVAHEIWFTLESDENTLRKYPYPFVLELGYELADMTVIVKWRVKNPAKDTMYFSIGGHPAFLCPIVEGTKQSDYRIKFDTGDKVISSCLESGLVSGKKITYELQNGVLPVTEYLFDGDALVIEHDQAHRASLVAPDGREYLTVTFDAPLFGIWSPPKKQAPFICIEPWYGRCDAEDYTGDWREREWMQTLGAGETFAADYKITIG
ncbi:MAG: aldose 1-epimerase family protein [Lachnospiraceae bacterium]|nr:aldose 1-epimerase family protein [Lachnospiraceae bacterium]